ncbi:hypothetical protein TCAL_16657 [Tigriopus californicus]|uniref:Uncharacterized protein n=1 Tax=Tigriopus californicus TaxID=6832 RepID=A0A553NB05_TIGCA|nr:jmjC domain-containing histone demethylation protein 1-like [Tigriopus californicus]TRY62626.1 hypothetical protein TCAL_16657 [Tigriopus californicus]
MTSGGGNVAAAPPLQSAPTDVETQAEGRRTAPGSHPLSRLSTCSAEACPSRYTNPSLVLDLEGKRVSVVQFQKQGFHHPIHVADSLADLQFEPTNAADEMMYPKVQKYCWMSVSGAWVDFRLEMGGASSWNYVHSGVLVIWLIPPTDENLQRFEDWAAGDTPQDRFLPEMVDACTRFELHRGHTLFIPAGWIHAIFSVHDTIAFRGKFLHSFGIEKQLQAAYIEEVLKIPQERRYPFFTELQWYVLDRYVHCVLGRTRLDLPEEEKRRIRLEKGDTVDANEEVFRLSSVVVSDDNARVHLTLSELHGLKFIIMYLHHLPNSKKSVPLMLPDPISIIKDVRELVLEHNQDCPEAAATGRYIINWGAQGKRGRKSGLSKQALMEIKHQKKTLADTTRKLQKNLSSTSSRRRRVRCKTCQACVGGDCQVCAYCKDMVKYGGPGRMKQTCEKRRCLHPQLPVCAHCSICMLDGWFKEPKLQSKDVDRPSTDDPPNLYECTVCLDIVHPECAEKSSGLGNINKDLSNSWECAKCSRSGFSQVPSRHTASKKRPLNNREEGGNNDDHPPQSSDLILGGSSEKVRKT